MTYHLGRGHLKATDEQLLGSYERLGSIWLVATELGMCGQSVSERLARLGVTATDRWTADDLATLKASYADSQSPIHITELAHRLHRLKSSVSRKARQLGLTNPRRRKDSTNHDRISQFRRRFIQEHGHPRGYREFRVCPACGKFFDVPHSSPVHFCSKVCGQSQSHTKEERFTNRKGGRRPDLGDIRFRSSWEANYARYLNYLMAQESSEIVRWEYEPKRFHFDKPRGRVHSYLPDFRITFCDNRVEYHEVKGWDYAKGKEARCQFESRYPHLKLVIRDRSWFTQLHRDRIDRLIPNWEFPVIKKKTKIEQEVAEPCFP